MALRLSDKARHTVAGELPPDTLSFLLEHGVPESVVLAGFEHNFNLDLEPLLDRGVFRLGTVDLRWCSQQIVVQRTTGHFGYVCHEEAVPLWEFCNTSVANFLKCCEVCDLMWELQKQNQIAYEARA